MEDNEDLSGLRFENLEKWKQFENMEVRMLFLAFKSLVYSKKWERKI